MAQTLTQMKQLLAAYGVRPKRSLGQNFLIDGNKLRQIMDAADIGEGSQVLEVGPGTGTLTEQLLAQGADVLAVEFDSGLEPLLRTRFAAALEAGQLRLIIGDVLDGKHALNPEVDSALRARRGPFQLIANLPYQVASPLLAILVSAGYGMERALVMLQKEVADRLTAPPGGKDYGALGVLIQAMCEVRRVTTLSPGCFWPAPQVESAVVSLRRRESPLCKDPTALSAMLQRLFGQRRKQLGSILGRDAVLPEGIAPSVRPEQLTVEQLAALAESLG